MSKIIAVHGLGIVGLIQSLKLCELGFTVFATDINPGRIETLSQGNLPFFEPDLESLIKKHLNKNLFIKEQQKISDIDCHIVCVGTPINPEGAINLDGLTSAIETINDMSNEYSIVVRSTIPPGTMESLIKKLNKSKDIIYYPEFLRQGSAWVDQIQEKKIYYSNIKGNSIYFKSLFKENTIFEEIEIKSAEFIKYMNNSFHALKVAFINEITSLANKFEVNIDEVQKMFLTDKKLNISSAYLTPGLPYGGHCLSKELSVLTNKSSSLNLDCSLISSIEKSNNAHILRCAEQLKNHQTVGFIGLGFKYNSGDSRNSPLFKIIEKMKDAKYWSYETGTLPKNIERCSNLSELIDYSESLVISTTQLSNTEWNIIYDSKKVIYLTSSKIKYPNYIDNINFLGK